MELVANKPTRFASQAWRHEGTSFREKSYVCAEAGPRQARSECCRAALIPTLPARHARCLHTLTSQLGCCVHAPGTACAPFWLASLTGAGLARHIHTTPSGAGPAHGRRHQRVGSFPLPLIHMHTHMHTHTRSCPSPGAGPAHGPRHQRGDHRRNLGVPGQGQQRVGERPREVAKTCHMSNITCMLNALTYGTRTTASR